MPCRVGMTQYPDERREFWQHKHPTLKNWTIVEQFSTKKAAQDFETIYAAQHGCVAEPGGEGDENAVWYVYRFEY